VLGVLAGCGGDAHPRLRYGDSAGRPVGCPPRKLRGIDIRSDATEVAVQSRTNAADQPVYTAHFSTTPKGARAFCAANGLGGALLRSAGVDATTRTRFAIEGDSAQTPFGCRAISPHDPQVQREVLVTVPTTATAVVHLIAFRMPR
jgi:hypothetical protein